MEIIPFQVIMEYFKSKAIFFAMFIIFIILLELNIPSS